MEPKSSPSILVVDDEQDMRWLLGNILRNCGFTVQQAQDGVEALSRVGKNPPDIVLLDIKMPHMDGMETLKRLKEQTPYLPVIMLTAYGDIPSSVQAIKLGAYDFLTKPFDNDQIVFTIRRALDHLLLRQEVASLREQIKGRTSLQQLMGSSRQIQQLSYQVDMVAKTSYTVLVQGETGTGKELLAHFIHLKSNRCNKPFVPVDCSAIPDTLIESELFGYERGAFTGANQTKPGYFEVAQRGTLFIDEVANIPYAIQKKLLRVLQERNFYRLGGNRPIEVDVRIIAASNVLLEDEVAAGRFRPDLYHRLTEFCIYPPPLRHRKEDILYLAKRFLDECSSELGKTVQGFSQDAVENMLAYFWPGNVRELRNLIRRAALLSPGIIQPYHLFPTTPNPPSPTHPPAEAGEGEVPADGGAGASLRQIGQAALEAAECKAIREALQKARGNKVKAAKLLQTDYKTLYRKLKKYQLSLD